MSIQNTSRMVNKLRGELADLNGKLSKEQANEEKIKKDIERAVTAIGRTKSSTTIRSKLASASRLEDKLSKSRVEQIKIKDKIKTKNKDLAKYETQLTKEQSREQQALKKLLTHQHEAAAANQQTLIAELQKLKSLVHIESDDCQIEHYDIFLSHASEDKDSFVRPLSEALEAAGLRIWYDEKRMSIGDSLTSSIDKGLVNSTFGVVVLSEAFFRKHWTSYEYRGLVATEMVKGEKTILPIWHDITKDLVLSHSPTLADKVAFNTGIHTLIDIVDELVRVVRGQ